MKDESMSYLDALKEIKRLKEALEQQPCEDAVSRQAVLDIIMPYCQDDDGSVENTGDLRNALDDIESLPPVTPKEKTGKWITQWNVAHQKEYYYCSECREEFSYDGETGIEMNGYNFCPNCGARMVSE